MSGQTAKKEHLKMPRGARRHDLFIDEGLPRAARHGAVTIPEGSDRTALKFMEDNRDRIRRDRRTVSQQSFYGASSTAIGAEQPLQQDGMRFPSYTSPERNFRKFQSTWRTTAQCLTCPKGCGQTEAGDREPHFEVTEWATAREMRNAAGDDTKAQGVRSPTDPEGRLSLFTIEDLDCSDRAEDRAERG